MAALAGDFISFVEEVRVVREQDFGLLSVAEYACVGGGAVGGRCC